MVRVTLFVVSLVLGADSTQGLAEEVRIREKVYTVLPQENLRARGLSVQDIARDENAAWQYIRAVNTYELLPDDLRDVLDEAAKKQWPESPALVEFLARPANRDALAIVAAATTLPACQMPFFGDPAGSIISAQLPNLTHLRTLGKMLIADGRLQVFRGEIDRGLGRFMEAARLATHVGSGATLIEQLIAISLVKNSQDAISQLVLSDRFSARQLTDLDRQLEAYAKDLPDMRNGLEGEKQFGPAIIDEIAVHFFKRSTPFVQIGVLGQFASSSPILDAARDPVPRDGWDRLEHRIARLLFPDRTIKAHMEGYYDACLRRYDEGAAAMKRLDTDVQDFGDKRIPSWDIFARILLPSLTRAIELGEEMRANFSMLRAAVRVRSYMATHDGRVPRSLDDVVTVKESADALFFDPFSRKRVRYNSIGDGWLVYSIGVDLVDDGGAPRGKHPRGRREGDLVLRYPPMEREQAGSENVGTERAENRESR